MKLSAFIVFSSDHHIPKSNIEEILKIINHTLRQKGITPVLLRNVIKSGSDYLEVLKSKIKETHFGIVVLDGLRPNVTFEMGLLYGVDIPVILLKSYKAVFSIRSLAYDSQLGEINPKILNLTEFKYSKLIDPILSIPDYFSDISGKHQARFPIHPFSTDSELKKILEKELNEIIKKYQDRTSVSEMEIYSTFQNYREISVKSVLQILALFSHIGWNLKRPHDTEFKHIRFSIIDLIPSYTNKQKNKILRKYSKIYKKKNDINRRILFLVRQKRKNQKKITQLEKKYENLLFPRIIVDDILEKLFEFGYIQDSGRFLALKSRNFIKSLLIELISSEDFNSKYLRKILENYELLYRMSERFIDFYKEPQIISFSKGILNNRALFWGIQMFQSKKLTKIFCNFANIDKEKGLEVLEFIFKPITVEKLNNILNSESTPTIFVRIGGESYFYDNIQEIIWFLQHAASFSQFFTRAMDVLKKFAQTLIYERIPKRNSNYQNLLPEEKQNAEIFEEKWIRHSGYHAFIEKCFYVSLDEISIETHWNYIKNLSENNIHEIDLKYDAIKKFLDQDIHIMHHESKTEKPNKILPDTVQMKFLSQFYDEAYSILFDWAGNSKYPMKIRLSIARYFLGYIGKYNYFYQNIIKTNDLIKLLKSFGKEFRISMVKYFNKFEKYESWRENLDKEFLTLLKNTKQSIINAFPLEDALRYWLKLSDLEIPVDFKKSKEFFAQLFPKLWKEIDYRQDKDEILLQIFKDISMTRNHEFIKWIVENTNPDYIYNLYFRYLASLSTPLVDYQILAAIGTTIISINPNKWKSYIEQDLWNLTTLLERRIYLLSMYEEVYDWMISFIEEVLEAPHSTLTNYQTIFWIIEKKKWNNINNNIKLRIVNETLIKILEKSKNLDYSFLYQILDFLSKKKAIVSQEILIELIDKIPLKNYQFFEKHNDFIISILIHDPSKLNQWIENLFKEISGIARDRDRLLQDISKHGFSKEIINFLQKNGNKIYLRKVSFEFFEIFSLNEQELLFNLNSEAIGLIIASHLQKIKKIPDKLKNFLLGKSKNINFMSTMTSTFINRVRVFDDHGTKYDGDISRIQYWMKSNPDLEEFFKIFLENIENRKNFDKEWDAELKIKI